MVIVAQLVEPRIVIPVVVGSSPIGHPRLAITKTRSSIYGIATEGHEGPLAQLVEQLTLNQRVAGRCQWGNPWEFDSPLSHQRSK